MRRRSVALLRTLPRSAHPALPSLVPPVRPSGRYRRSRLRRLPTAAGVVGAVTLPLRRPGAPGRPPAEVLGLARRRIGAGVRDRRLRGPAGGRRHHVGAAGEAAPVRPRVRPGARPGLGARPSPARARPPAAPAHARHRSAGAASGADRRAAMAGAFAPVRPSPRRVLLVDDVLTTGATVAACAEALAAAGAREIHVATAARSLHAPALRARRDRAYPGRALVRVCGCPGIIPGSRCQPRAKRPT